MQKLHLLFLLILLLPLSLLAQERTKINVDRFERGTVDNKTNTSYLRKPVFRQDNAILTCDSAVFYEARNVFEAFNNVHINQADTVNIYSDRLTYDGNTKIAHLTSNVRLLDRESVLTTNVLDYNMASKIGTYVNGGKIVNKDVTLTSRNGYYFASTRDAYFRYNVKVVTPQTTILSDTLRYNTLTNWTYFYGPTNIKGKDDNLYTENGAYNTKTEYAYFGKKNLYTSGSKSLKGDSLYYDGVAGYGKAVRNIVFRDTTDKTSMYGQLGYFYKIDQRTVVTKNAYVGLGTNDSVVVNNVKRPDSLWLGADTLETQMVLRKTLKLLPLPVIQKDNELGEVVPEGGSDTDTDAEPATKEPIQNPDTVKVPTVDSLKNTTDRIPKDSVSNKTDTVKTPAVDASKNKSDRVPKVKRKKRNAKVKSSTVDSLKSTIDSVVKDSVISKIDTVKTAAVDSLKNNADRLATVKLQKDSISGKAKVLKQDTTKKAGPGKNPSDTVKARIIKAYHNVKVYKSNLQARTDSLFYTSADSTLRWYHNPIFWAEGSQQTGDTIYLQLRNKKLNSVQVLQNGFTVNVYKDSTKFNQIKGKLMTGFFKDGKLNRMYVDGNSESVYFSKTDKGDYDKMNRTISSRIKILFKDSEISEIVPIKDVEGTATPANEVKEEVILTGFIWKPENRPTSKTDITNPKAQPKTKPKTTATAKGGVKPGVKSAVDSTAKTPVKTPIKGDVKTEAKADSTLKADSTVKATDTTKKAVKPLPTAKKQ